MKLFLLLTFLIIIIYSCHKSAKPHINRVNFGSLEIAKWYHLVFTWDGSFMKAYINGNLIGEPIEQTHNIPVTSDPLIIGKKPFGRHPGFFHGQIDQVSIYDRALTDSEVMLLYKEKLTFCLKSVLIYFLTKVLT